MYTLKLICMPNFSSLGWFSFSSNVISCWQLLTADGSFYEIKLSSVFIHTLKVICMPNFCSVGWFLFLPTFISCHQPLTAGDSWWQLMTADTKKVYMNVHVHSIGDIFAKFYLSWLIFIFISFFQLLSAVDSWWELSQKNQLDFSCTP